MVPVHSIQPALAVRDPSLALPWRVSMKPSLAIPGRSLRFRALLVCLFAMACLLPSATRAQVTFSGAQTTIGSGFSGPQGAVVDASGNVFVADTGHGEVKEILAAGGYTTVHKLGSGFDFPASVAVDASGNVFVADTFANTVGAVKEILAAGGYTTVNTIGSGFKNPQGVAVDVSGNVFVADSGNNAVKEIVASGGFAAVNTLGSGFNDPQGVAVDGSGNVFVADTHNLAVKEIVAASSYTFTRTLITGFYPFGVAVDGSENLFVSDHDNNAVKEFLVEDGYATFNTLGAGFKGPYGVAIGKTGNAVVADTGNNRVVELVLAAVSFGSLAVASHSAAQTLYFSIAPDTTVGGIAVLTTGNPGRDFASAGTNCELKTYTVAASCQVNVRFDPRAPGLRRGGVVFTDAAGNQLADVAVYGVGTGPEITFQPGVQTTLATGLNAPTGLAQDADGNIFAAANGGVLEFLAAGGYTTVKTLSSTIGGHGLALDGSGNVFVTDSSTGGIQEILKAGGYKTVATIGGRFGFSYPGGVAVDGSGNVFVADFGNNAVEEILAEGGYTTVNVLSSSFYYPDGVAVDANGNVFVADSFHDVVKEIFAEGGYTTIISLGSGLHIPTALALDPSGNIYVADYGNNAVKELLVDGGYADTIAIGSGFQGPSGVAVSDSGNVFVGDPGKFRIVKLDYADPPALTFATTPVGSTSAGGPQTVEIANIGNGALEFTTPASGHNPSYPANFPENRNDMNLCRSGLPVDPGTSCDVSINFVPLIAGANAGDVVLTDDDLNHSGAVQKIALKAAATKGEPVLDWAAPAPIEYGTALSKTQLNASASVPGTFVYAPAAGTLLAGGLHTLSVEFTPTDASAYKTASAKVTLTVDKAKPAVNLTSSASSITYGASVTLTATLTGRGAKPSGTVEFFSGAKELGTALLDTSGIATFSTAKLPAGKDSITASYEGSANYSPETSAGVSVTVTNPAGAGAAAP